jgi:hypothetical protein
MAIALLQLERGSRAQAFKVVKELFELAKSLKECTSLCEVATIYANTGDLGASAQAFAKALQIAKEEYGDLCRNEILEEIALRQAQVTQFDKALDTVQEIERYRDRVRTLCTIAGLQGEAGMTEAARSTMQTASQIAEAIEDKWDRLHALHAIALAQAEMRDFASAMATAQASAYDRQRVESGLEIARLQAKAGFGGEAVRTAETILTDRNERLPDGAKALAGAGDGVNLKQLLLPCAYSLDAAYRMCGLLARVYPEQAAAVAGAVRKGENAS